KKAFDNWLAVMVGTGAAVLYFLHADNLALLLAGGLLVMLVSNRKRLKLPGKRNLRGFLLPSLGAGITAASTAVPFSLAVLFLTFLKIGAILYGSGYVLVAFLRADFVSRLGWLTEQQLLDAIAIGQITPGPLFTSATFIGFLVGGLPGAVLATIGIFLPSYVFVALSNPLIPRIRSSPWAGALLDGVIAASLGLMAAVSLQLGQAALIDLPSILIFLVSAVILLRWRPNATWLIAAGALVGWLMYLSGHY
ncbi:MAG: chromate transporter, partial [Omnitrophica WOR_2 bacterium]